MINFAVPFDVGPFAAHAHTTTVFQGKVSFFGKLLSQCSQGGVLAAVWPGAHFQSVGVIQTQAGNSLDKGQQKSFLDRIGLRDHRNDGQGNTPVVFGLDFRQKRHQRSLICGSA